jgi:uncharacterized membrane protein YcaP (DUF421 family)
MNWDSIFGVTGQIGTAQESARAIVIFFYGWLLVRVSGKRLFGKWGALDIIVSILVGSNLSRALTGQAPLLGTLVATSLLIACHWLLTTAATRSPRLSRLFEGCAVDIVADGRIDELIRSRERISRPDIDEALHGAGLKTLDEVHRMTIEPSGKITVIKRPPPS